MKVIFAGGGTAGHINPALAIANHLRDHTKGVDILFVGTPTGMEKELVVQAGYAFAPIRVRGFMRKLSPQGVVHNLCATAQVITSSFIAKKIIKEFHPDIVIGTGGYVSGPVVRVASNLGIKTMIHEQNAFPGITNKLLARKVNCVLLAVEDAKKNLPAKARFEVVGNPIRESVLSPSKQQARKTLGIGSKFCVLSFGGSLGARVINQAAADLIEWNQKHHKVVHIHGYGTKQKEMFANMLAERKLSFEELAMQQEHSACMLYPYLKDMGLYLAAADLVICRAGAMTLSELQACGKPSILIPSPYVAENHQYHNAMVLKNHGAAEVLIEEDYKKEDFLQLLAHLVQDKKSLERLGRNASTLAIVDTTQRIAQIMTSVID